MTERKKALVVLASDEYVRNYLTTDALHEVERNWECHFLAAEGVTNRALLESKPGFAGYYRFEPRMQAMHYNIFAVLMWRHRRRVPSFAYRVMRMMHVTMDPARGVRERIAAAGRYALKKVRSWRQQATLAAAAGIGYPLFRRWLARVPVNEGLRAAIDRLSPDLIVFPSSNYDPAGPDLARIANARGIPTLVLIDNWDNISSKTVMWAKPAHIGVWGQQSVEHAIAIQKMPPDRITRLGTPRFDQYFRLRHAPLPSHFSYPYVLFVGTAIAFDEGAALAVLDETIERNRAAFGDVKIVYRPHPWRQGDDSIAGRRLRHVVVDPQLADWYNGGQRGPRLQPDLTYYPRLLKNAELVVGGLTSMVIESQIFWKRFLALVYPEPGSLTSPHHALRYFVHLHGVEKLPSIDMCASFDRLGEQFLDSWTRRAEVDPAQIDAMRRYFLYDEEAPYKVRLNRLAERVAATWSAEVPPETSDPLVAGVVG